MGTKKISLKELKKRNNEHRKKMELLREILDLADKLDRLMRLDNEIKKLQERVKKI